MSASDLDPSLPNTRWLADLMDGRAEPRPESMALLYAELHRIAEACFRSQSAAHTLQPTALVHEAFAKLQRGERISEGGRHQFFAIAARAMRQILVDHARTKQRRKRGGAAHQNDLVAIDSITAGSSADPDELLDLDRALLELAARDARQARIVELRFFGGLEMSEVAACLEVSLSTAEREWRVARAWLGQRLAAN